MVIMIVVVSGMLEQYERCWAVVLSRRASVAVGVLWLLRISGWRWDLKSDYGHRDYGDQTGASRTSGVEILRCSVVV